MHSNFGTIPFDVQFYKFTRFTFHMINVGIRDDINSFILKQLMHRHRNILILAMKQPVVSLDNSYATTAKRRMACRKFKADITAANHKQMFRDPVQFKRFRCVSKVLYQPVRSGINRRMASRIDDNLFTPRSTRFLPSGEVTSMVLGAVKRPELA